MASLPTQFAQVFAPLLWAQEFAMFGRTVNYYQISIAPDDALALDVIWKEGRADEEVSPGRYSHVLVQNADLAPGPPQEGDIIESDGRFFDVVSVEADPSGFSRLILQEQGDAR